MLSEMWKTKRKRGSEEVTSEMYKKKDARWNEMAVAVKVMAK